MKAAIEKALSALSSYGRGPRVEGSEEGSVDEQELHKVETRSVRISRDNSLTPEEFCSEVAKNTTEGDDVLFSKNNIFLKKPLLTIGKIKHESSSNPEDTNLDQNSKALDNHMLIPGFLFVTTRGSNFGTTLILNWAPNSSMKVPNLGDHQSKCSTISAVDVQCNSVSIDLCSMEMIRIFYHMDEEGFIISGELVVKSKAEEFKVNESLVVILEDQVSTCTCTSYQVLLLQLKS